MSIRKTIGDCMLTVVKGAWEILPPVLAAIPPTAVAGNVLIQVKNAMGKLEKRVEKVEKSVDEIEKNVTEQQKVHDALQEIINECGGEQKFKEILFSELKNVITDNNIANPKFINCAIFTVKSGYSLSEEEQSRLFDTLTGEIEADDKQTAEFVYHFRDDYFAGDYYACDNAIQMEDSYIAFNFDEYRSIEYSEEDLEFIRDEMNKIVGRDVFGEYEGFGTDDENPYDPN